MIKPQGILTPALDCESMYIQSFDIDSNHSFRISFIEITLL